MGSSFFCGLDGTDGAFRGQSTYDVEMVVISILTSIAASAFALFIIAALSGAQTERKHHSGFTACDQEDASAEGDGDPFIHRRY